MTDRDVIAKTIREHHSYPAWTAPAKCSCGQWSGHDHAVHLADVIAEAITAQHAAEKAYDDLAPTFLEDRDRTPREEILIAALVTAGRIADDLLAVNVDPKTMNVRFHSPVENRAVIADIRDRIEATKD